MQQDAKTKLLTILFIMKPMHFLTTLCMAVCMMSCTPKDDNQNTHRAPLKNPTRVTLEQVPFTATVNVTWQDNCDNEAGYEIYVKTNNGEPNLLVTLAADTQSYTIGSGLNQGQAYSIGVRALSDGSVVSSQVIYKEIALFDYTQLPVATLLDEVVSTPTSAMLKYNFKQSDKYPVSDWGLCWSAEHEPTVEDGHASGPLNSKIPIVQAISNLDMEYGKTYKVRAYLTTAHGTTYSNSVDASLGEEPKAITLAWEKVENADLPSDIVLYKTTQELNGRPFNAWYAIADVTKGNVEFRMEFSSTAKTLEKFYSDANCIMTNAGYFNMATGVTGDYHVDAGVLYPSSASSTLRGTFGVDQDQVPAVLWSAKTTTGDTYYYNAPMMNLAGYNTYAPMSETYPYQSIEWRPYYAMAAGPLLVKDGRIVIDLTSENGTLVRNYENIASDIFTTATPDRTCVGYTEDGKIILFICDGRITVSKGANILEAAQIMKGLGCVGAVNFDGGGSTAMTVYGKRINSLLSNTSGGTENRPVGSVMGFYKKN